MSFSARRFPIRHNYVAHVPTKTSGSIVSLQQISFAPLWGRKEYLLFIITDWEGIRIEGSLARHRQNYVTLPAKMAFSLYLAAHHKRPKWHQLALIAYRRRRERRMARSGRSMSISLEDTALGSTLARLLSAIAKVFA